MSFRLNLGILAWHLRARCQVPGPPVPGQVMKVEPAWQVLPGSSSEVERKEQLEAFLVELGLKWQWILRHLAVDRVAW